MQHEARYAANTRVSGFAVRATAILLASCALISCDDPKQRHVTLRGVVTAPDGSALRDAWVAVTVGGSRVGKTLSAHDGSFTLRVPPSGPYVVVLAGVKPGVDIDPFADPRRAWFAQVEVPDATSSVQLRAVQRDSSGQIRLVTLGPDDAVVAAIEVTIDPPSIRGVMDATSDDQGLVEFTDIIAMEHCVTIHPNYERAMLGVVLDRVVPSKRAARVHLRKAKRLSIGVEGSGSSTNLYLVDAQQDGSFQETRIGRRATDTATFEFLVSPSRKSARIRMTGGSSPREYQIRLQPDISASEKVSWKQLQAGLRE